MQKNKLRFLIVGLGSMGRRRIRNLFANNEHNIVGYDTWRERMLEVKKEYGIDIIDNIGDISWNDVDVIFICTPPDRHGDYIRLALKNRKHFFVEHPISDDGFDDIFKSKNRKLVMAPSSTFLYSTPIKMVKKFLEKGSVGKILAYQYHMGQYLPDWHTYEDYRRVYFSKKNTSACKEMFSFELIWLNWLMNSNISEVSGYIRKVSDLDMDADDILLSNLKYENGIFGNIIIDVISRKAYRTLRILGTKGVLEYEMFDQSIKLFDASSKKMKIVKVPKSHPHKGYINDEEMYNDEIKMFLAAINNKKKYLYTFKENHHLLKALYALEKSDCLGKVVSLKKNGSKNKSIKIAKH